MEIAATGGLQVDILAARFLERGHHQHHHNHCHRYQTQIIIIVIVIIYNHK